MRHSTFLPIVLLMTAAIPSLAKAEPDAANKAAADMLFDEAKKLVLQGHYAEACPKFAESQRIDPGVGTLLYLADCYEQTGRTASAWSGFREAAAAAKTAGQHDRERMAREAAAALEPKLSKLQIVLTSPVAANLIVRRDGIVVGRALWGSAVPIDPGSHIIDASAPGKISWSTHLETASNATTTVVRVPVLPDAPNFTESNRTAQEALKTPRSDTSGRSTQRALALTFGGIGLVGIGIGTGFGLSAKSTYDASGPECESNNICSDEGIRTRKAAFTKAAVATAGFAVGGVCLVGGTLLWLTAPSSSKRVGVAANTQGLNVQGVW